MYGNEQQLVDKAETWYELLVAKILYQKGPFMSKNDIKYLIPRICEIFPDLTTFDQILMLIIEEDVSQLSEKLQEYDKSSWLVAHLYDLLTHFNAGK